ncbi:MAG: patatin-like phospholipase family protein [Bacteroidales bacterium]
MEAHLPKNPLDTLALSLSGGGYRAASFHLGLLTYLDSVIWKGESLLKRTRILSTVSGGTFTGVCYATTLADGKSLADCYKKLYHFMKEVDLIEESLKNLDNFKNWKSEKGRSLINAFSMVYFQNLEKNTFSMLSQKGYSPKRDYIQRYRIQLWSSFPLSALPANRG